MKLHSQAYTVVAVVDRRVGNVQDIDVHTLGWLLKHLHDSKMGHSLF